MLFKNTQNRFSVPLILRDFYARGLKASIKLSHSHRSGRIYRASLWAKISDSLDNGAIWIYLIPGILLKLEWELALNHVKYWITDVGTETAMTGQRLWHQTCESSARKLLFGELSKELYLLLIKVELWFVGTCWFLAQPLHSDHAIKLGGSSAVSLGLHKAHLCNRLLFCFAFWDACCHLVSQSFSYFQDLLLGFFFSSMTNQEFLVFLILTWTGIVCRMFCWSKTLLLKAILFSCKLGKKSSSQVANLAFKAVRNKTFAVPLWVRLCSLGYEAHGSASHYFQVLWWNCCAPSAV